MSRCSPEATARAALTASLFLVAHELPVRRTPSTKAAWADLTLVLVRSMNLGRSHFDELRVAFLTERVLQNVPVGCRQPMGSMRANGIRVYTPTGMVRALMRVGRSRSAIPALTNSVTSSTLCASWASTPLGKCLCCWQPTALTAEPPQRNSSCTAIPCAIASNGSEKLTGLDLQKSPGPEPALAGHPVQSDQAASGPIGRSGPPKKMNGA